MCLYRSSGRGRPARRQSPPTASLPPSEALLNMLLRSLRQVTANGETLLEIEDTLRSVWPLLLAYSGYDSVWFRLLALANYAAGPDWPMAPLWPLQPPVCPRRRRPRFARPDVGRGRPQQRPSPAIPAYRHSVRLRRLDLIHVWGVLIAYRGLEVAHGLSPGPAALVAVGAWLLLLLVSSIVAVALGALFIVAGGGL